MSERQRHWNANPQKGRLSAAGVLPCVTVKTRTRKQKGGVETGRSMHAVSPVEGVLLPIEMLPKSGVDMSRCTGELAVIRQSAWAADACVP